MRFKETLPPLWWGAGRPFSGFLERTAGSKDTSEGAQSGQGQLCSCTELKDREELHPHCGASHPFVLVSLQGFERCHPSGKLGTGPLWSQQPATSFCQQPTTPSPLPLTLIPAEWPTAWPSFFLQDATLHLALKTFPGADLFAGDCWPPGASLLLPPSPMRSLMWAEPEESSPGLLPFFQMRCWPESGGLFLRKLFPCVYGWKRCWSFDDKSGGMGFKRQLT